MSNDDLARARRTGVTLWVWLAVGGVVSVLLGLVAVLSPDASLRVLAVVLSLWLVATGLGRMGLAGAVRTWSVGRRGLQVAVGVVLAAVGVAGLLGLWDALTVVTVVVAVGFLVAAATDLLTAATGPRGAGRAATGSLGVLHLLVGLTFLLLPEVGLALLAGLVGIVLVGLGLVQLGASALVRSLVHRADAVVARLDRPDDGDGPRVIRGEIL